MSVFCTKFLLKLALRTYIFPMLKHETAHSVIVIKDSNEVNSDDHQKEFECGVAE